MGANGWLSLNQDTSAAGRLCGGLQVTVTFSPLLTVRFVGCWVKLQSISGKMQHMHFLCVSVCLGMTVSTGSQALMLLKGWHLMLL